MANPTMVVGYGATRERRETFELRYRDDHATRYLSVPYGFCFYAVTPGQKLPLFDLHSRTVLSPEELRSPAYPLPVLREVMEGPSFLPFRHDPERPAETAWGAREVLKTAHSHIRFVFRERLAPMGEEERFLRAWAPPDYWYVVFAEAAAVATNERIWTVEDLQRLIVTPLRQFLREQRIAMDVLLLPEVTKNNSAVISVDVES